MCSCAPGAAWNASRSARSSPPGFTGSRSTRPNAGFPSEDRLPPGPVPEGDDPVTLIADRADYGPSRQALDREFESVLRDARRELPDDWRAAVVLRDIEGLSTEEAAEVTGVHQAAFKSRLHRGRMQLRSLLEPYIRLEER